MCPKRPEKTVPKSPDEEQGEVIQFAHSFVKIICSFPAKVGNRRKKFNGGKTRLLFLFSEVLAVFKIIWIISSLKCIALEF